jgi:hypothetical protein
MHPTETRRVIVTTALIVVAAVMDAVQIVTNQPTFGAIGLVLLAIPGIVLAQALPPRPTGWPEITLVIVGTSLSLMVLIGIATGLSGRGLDTSSVAALHLLALGGTGSAWIWRLDRNPRTWIGPPIRVASSSVLLGLLGMAFGAAGFLVATRAAENQPYAPFVQLWSVPPSAGTEPTLGVRNGSRVTIDCDLTIYRPGASRFDVHIGTIDPGGSWESPLPPRESTDPTPWDIALDCAGADGSTFGRRLSIDPPA